MIKEALPDGWKVVKLGEVCKLKNGFAFKSTDYVNDGTPVIRISDIKSGSVTSKKAIKVTPNIEYENYLIENNDLLVAMSGATTGKFGIYKSSEKAYQNQRVGKFKILDNSALDNIFLYYQLHALKRRIEKDAYGGAQPNISSTKIEEMEILLPPLPEQQLIVEKIEELFSELDKSIENLKTAQQQLKVYRQAVLKWAFEGKLTNEEVKDGELPEGWEWIKSGKLFSFVTSGSRGWAKFYSTEGAIFIRVTNLDFDSIELDLSKRKLQYVNPPLTTEGIRTKIQEGDFLFSITGYLGMFAIAPKLENAYVNQHVCLCRPNNSFNKRYVAYWIISKSGGHHYLNKDQKGAVKAGLNLDDLKSFPVPICPIEEQGKIVQEIESRLSVCDKMEETITASLQQAEALRQSILKKAFEGKLVKKEETAEQAKIVSINNQHDVWERKVLAGYIIFCCHKDRYFGRTKFQKTLYLCEQYAQLNYETAYLKKAAGPLDASFIYPFIKEGEEKNWFVETTETTPYYFELLDNIGELTSQYPTLFREVGAKISFIINHLKGKSTDESELIATIYSIWNNYIIEGKTLEADFLVKEVYDWSESKAKFKRSIILSTWNWIKEVGLAPVGFGKLIGK